MDRAKASPALATSADEGGPGRHTSQAGNGGSNQVTVATYNAAGQPRHRQRLRHPRSRCGWSPCWTTWACPNWSPASPGSPRWARRLPHPVPALPGSEVVHGDFTTRNVLGDQGRLAAVIDLTAWAAGTHTIDLVALTKALAPGFDLAVAAIGSGRRANALVLPVCHAALAVGRYRSGMRSDMRVAEAPDPAIPALSLGLLARRSWPWALAVALALLVFGLLFGGRASWGDVATWVVAVTTLLAFVAASFAGIVAYKVLAVETRRDLLADSERIAAQAAEVAAWSGRKKAETFISSDGPDTWPEWGAVIRNASGLPVYGLRVWFCDPADPAPGSELRTLTWYESPELTDVLPPGDAFVSPPREITKRRAAGSTERWLIAVEFADAAGHRWLREPQGKLTPAGQADPLPARHRREPVAGPNVTPRAGKAPQ